MKREPFAHSLQVFGMHLGLAILPRLPRPVILVLAAVIGRTVFLCSKKLRRIGNENLNLVYGDEWTPSQRNALLRQMFRNYALNLLDLFWFMRHAEKRMTRHIEVEPSLQAIMQDQGLIIMTGHFGNWELIGKALNQFGMPLQSIAATLENKRLDEAFIRIREDTGQKIIPQKGAIRSLLRVLKSGGNVAMLLDQNTLPRDGGLFVPFFGKPAPVSSAVAAIIRKTRCKVVTGFCRVDEKGQYHAYIRDHIVPEDWDRKDDPDPLLTITQTMTRCMEAEIRRYPDQWMWAYKRWKYFPPDGPREGYPSYSREIKAKES